MYGLLKGPYTARRVVCCYLCLKNCKLLLSICNFLLYTVFVSASDKRTSLERSRALEKSALAELELIDTEESEIIKAAAFEFQGDGTTLGSALGALLICKLYGYRVLRLTYDLRTLSRYEKILQAGTPGFKFRDYSRPLGPLARRSVAYRITEAVGRWWDVVSGKISGRGSGFDLGIDSTGEDN